MADDPMRAPGQEALERAAAALEEARQAGEQAAEELRRSRDVQARADQALTDARRVTGSPGDPGGPGAAGGT